MVNQLRSKLADGTIKMPGKKLLLWCMIKLDILKSLYERMVLRNTRGFAFGSSDSSSGKYGFNVLATRVIRYSWPLKSTDEEIVASDWEKHRREYYLPFSNVGYGAADCIAKTSHVCTKVMLESGNKENFQKGTEEYHGWTTDQGIDEKAVDAVKCYPDTFGDPGDLSVAESSMDNGEDRLGSCHTIVHT